MRRLARGVMVGAFCFGAAVTGVTQHSNNQPTGQMPGAPTLPSGRDPRFSDGMDTNPLSTRNEEQQVRARSNERQKRILSDTELLLRLATELKTDVDKTNKDVMSLDVIKKADEIEKLAHNVKERMKG